MSKHKFHFMEVQSLSDFDSVLLGPYDKPGFIAVCDDTGIMVATDPTDGWQDYPEASRKPIHRIPFALQMHCHQDNGEGIVHELADQ